jgi:hypothetical protein
VLILPSKQYSDESERGGIQEANRNRIANFEVASERGLAWHEFDGKNLKAATVCPFTNPPFVGIKIPINPYDVRSRLHGSNSRNLHTLAQVRLLTPKIRAQELKD